MIFARCWSCLSVRLFSRNSREGLVKEEAWRRGKSNKYNVEDEHYANRLKEAVDAICKDDFQPDPGVFSSLLKQCGNARALAQGRRVHARIVETGLDQDKLVNNFVVYMYGKCRDVDSARRVFGTMPRRNEFSFSIMLQAFAEAGRMREAQNVLDKMPQQAEISLTTMISGYARNGFLKEAERIFDSLPVKELVAWTAMVTAYAQNGDCSRALNMFRLMDLDGWSADSVGFISVLDACANAKALKEGRIIHENATIAGLDSNTKVVNMLIHLYGKCGRLREARALFDTMPEKSVVSWTSMVAVYAQNGHTNDAREIFDEMPYRNVVSWNAMVAAYAENGYGRQALEIFRLMDLDGAQPDVYTYLSSLSACSSIPSPAYGRILHAELRESPKLAVEPKVGNALLDMYAKCGHLRDAVAVFKQMPVKVLAAWNSMIGAYAQTGHGNEALEVFGEMGVEGVSPDEISFINVLCGCAYSGLSKEGVRIFVGMTSDYGIQRVYDHFVCAVNVLACAGMLEQAEELADCMPFVTDEVPWMALLNACRVHNDVARAARAAERARKLNPRVSAPYVMLSSVYKSEDSPGVPS